MTTILRSHVKDLGGGFTVKRVLPNAQRQSVGPFLFFDHFGPVELAPEVAFDVRPHPHIGLATVTYLFDGAIMHRDSLGNARVIEPGAINWMTAGRGIVHSERTPDELRAKSRRMHGLQLWAGLPHANEEDAPNFVHTPATAIPLVEGNDWTVRVLIGSAFGRTSPVAVYSPTLYLDIALAPGAALRLPATVAERAIYPVDAAVTLDELAVEPQTMVVLNADIEARLHARDGARVIVIGGAPLDGPRTVWWNFVSSSRERIERAKAEWTAQAMGQVPGETEFIPLP